MIPYSNEYVLQYIAKLTTKEYTDGLEKMEDKTSESTGKINKNFDSMSSFIGKAIKSKFSLAAAAVYFANKTRLAIQDMIAFQKQLSTVNTLLKGSREELNKYADEFINLSIRTGQAKEDIANGAYQALSSGVAKEDLVNFLEVATKTAQAGLTTTETSIQTISSIMNAYKMTATEAGEIADWLLTVQNKGVTTVGELGSYLSDVTSIAAPLNVALNDIGAALAQMTQNGNNTAKSTTMLKTMLSELSKEGQKAADVFTKIAGQSFRDFISNGGDLQGALNLMEQHAKSTNKSIVDLFGSVEAGSAALNLTGLNAQKFSEKLNDMKNKSGELNTAYEIATANIKTEWDRLCNAMDSRWRQFVTWMEEPIYVTIKEIRQAIDGQDNAVENLDSNRAKLAELEAKKAKLNKNKSARYRDREKGELLGEITALKAEIKRGEEILAQQQKELEEKRAEEEKKRKAQQALEAKQAAVQASIDRAEAVEAKEKEHKNKLVKVDIDYLKKKKDYMQEQQNLLNMGIISKDEYDRNVKLKDQELLQQQRTSNASLYREMEEFYRKLGELEKANEFKKKVIEVELQITQNTTLNAENREDLFLQAEAEKRKEYQAELLANEWEFLTQLAEMRENGSLTETQIEEFKEQRMKELELARLEREAEELQNRLDFYNSSEDYKQQAVDTLQKIEENALKREKILDKKGQKDRITAADYKEAIMQRSYNATMEAYDMLAKGQLKSLDDFKKFAQLQLAELLYSLGNKHATQAASDLAIAISTVVSDPPLSASKFAGAAKNAAVAAAFGVASSVVRGDSDGSSERETTKNRYDDEIDKRVEDAGKESEGNVIIDVSDSQMAKVMIKQIEKELKDGYNVTLIGKKKR
jgi:TP901 family phage tail tape measure protein|nr:MAG TPA_asm: minor tail protein [Caudoviricetes sp.]